MGNDWTMYNRDFRDCEPYTLRDVVEGMGYELGLSDYPIFDEDYRDKLNAAIVSHFWYRRIASDTPQIFIYYLNRRMNENMPTYNAIYKKLLEDKYDPIATEQAWSEADTESNATSDAKAETGVKTHNEEKSDSGNTSTATNSTTPQVWLDNPEGHQYMDALAKTDSTGAATGQADGTSDTDETSNQVDWGHVGANAYTKAINGGSSAAIYDVIDSGFIATDTLVFTMLEPLFIQFMDDEPY